jgi:hypothetical protein
MQTHNSCEVIHTYKYTVARSCLLTIRRLHVFGFLCVLAFCWQLEKYTTCLQIQRLYIFAQTSFMSSKLAKTKQAMYVRRNIEALSRKKCCCGKTVSATYYECVSMFVAFIRHENHIFFMPYYVVIGGLHQDWSGTAFHSNPGSSQLT